MVEAQNAKLLHRLQEEAQKAAEAELRLKTQFKSYAIAEGELLKTLTVNKALKE